MLEICEKAANAHVLSLQETFFVHFFKTLTMTTNSHINSHVLQMFVCAVSAKCTWPRVSTISSTSASSNFGRYDKSHSFVNISVTPFELKRDNWHPSIFSSGKM